MFFVLSSPGEGVMVPELVSGAAQTMFAWNPCGALRLRVWSNYSRTGTTTTGHVLCFRTPVTTLPPKRW